MIRAVRGAVGIERNDAELIHSESRRLFREILKRNQIEEGRIVSVLFSVTKDLTKANPATGVRLEGFADTPLFCVQEADIEGAEPGIVRILVTYGTDSDAPAAPVYLGRAAELRPDLSGPQAEEAHR